MLDETKYIECNCDSAEHTLRFHLDYEDKEIYLETCLYQWRPLYKRIWIGIKYIFGYECKYGHWDCTTLNLEKVKELHQLCREFIQKVK